ncbi:MAG: hypothetical protein IH850_04460 [Acidobacteria bacterium]|nr:hypothetical protein [Acidobacteriota bacterium]
MTSSVSIRRRVQWIDTDAAGIWHHSTVARWAEEAEAELHRQLGIIDQTFGATPRVVVEFEFRSPLRFDDVVDVTITVAKLGRSSITYLGASVPVVHITTCLGAKAEHQAPAGHLVEGVRLERHHHRRPAPDADDTGADLDAVR